MEKDVGITVFQLFFVDKDLQFIQMFILAWEQMYSEKCSITFVCIIYWYNSWLVVNILISVEFIPKRATWVLVQHLYLNALVSDVDRDIKL